MSALSSSVNDGMYMGKVVPKCFKENGATGLGAAIDANLGFLFCFWCRSIQGKYFVQGKRYGTGRKKI